MDQIMESSDNLPAYKAFSIAGIILYNSLFLLH